MKFYFLDAMPNVQFVLSTFENAREALCLKLKMFYKKEYFPVLKIAVSTENTCASSCHKKVCRC